MSDWPEDDLGRAPVEDDRARVEQPAPAGDDERGRITELAAISGALDESTLARMARDDEQFAPAGDDEPHRCEYLDDLKRAMNRIEEMTAEQPAPAGDDRPGVDVMGDTDPADIRYDELPAPAGDDELRDELEAARASWRHWLALAMEQNIEIERLRERADRWIKFESVTADRLCEVDAQRAAALRLIDDVHTAIALGTVEEWAGDIRRALMGEKS